MRPAEVARAELRRRTGDTNLVNPTKPKRPERPKRPGGPKVGNVKKIYMAGKISKNDWRHDYAYVRGCEPFTTWSTPFKNTDLLTYVGPFFASCDHGCAHGNTLHAVRNTETGAEDGDCGFNNENDDDGYRKRVHKASIERIDHSDLVIAVIDDDAHGTIFEVGYAIASGKPVILVKGDNCKEAWFPLASQNAGKVVLRLSVDAAVQEAERWASSEARFELQRSRCESPLEIAFFDEAWATQQLQTFDVNVPVLGGKYRIDFADVDRMIAIELDGHSFHSDKEAFENDRVRERELEEAGWRVLRFAGTEIYRDVSKCVSDAVSWIEKITG